jgi:uncharacterized protein (DUF433 family)
MLVSEQETVGTSIVHTEFVQGSTGVDYRVVDTAPMSTGKVVLLRIEPQLATRRFHLAEIMTAFPSSHPSIEATPGVCGGAARIAGTRIPVWTLVRFRQLGTSDDDLLSFYPSLTRERLAEAWAYEADHQDEIASQIVRNEAA